MNINIQTYSGESLAVEIGALVDFRLRYFREFPYLYVGAEEGEREHIAEYTTNPTARLVITRDGERIIGVAIGTMLFTETEILCQAGEPLQQLGIVPELSYYFGEMILVPEERSKGIGKQMLEALKNAGQEQGATRFCFLSVTRESNDVRRPAGYVDSDVIFRKFGFEKTDVFVTFEWKTVQSDGSIEKVANQLDLWIDNML